MEGKEARVLIAEMKREMTVLQKEVEDAEWIYEMQQKNSSSVHKLEEDINILRQQIDAIKAAEEEEEASVRNQRQENIARLRQEREEAERNNTILQDRANRPRLLVAPPRLM